MTPTPHAGIPAPAAEWAEVRRLAEAATAGPWMYPVGGAVVSLPARKSVFFGEATVPDMRFAAAANPSTVLRLLAERDRLREAAIATLRDYHLVAFDSGHDHPVEECHLPLFKERVALFAAPRDAGAGLDAAWRAAEAVMPEGHHPAVEPWIETTTGPGREEWHFMAYPMRLEVVQGTGRGSMPYGPFVTPYSWTVEGYGPTPAAALNALAAALRAPAAEEAHVHEWVDATNEIVKSGCVCPSCGAIRAALQTPGAPGSGDGE